MRPIRFERFDPLLSEADGRAMLGLCERFGRYGMYSEEGTAGDLGTGLAQRQDAALNFVNTGGRFGRKESMRTLAARTNYFRETYAYAAPVVEGIECLLHHAGFAAAARQVFDRPIVEPAIVYANILIPGQELAVHTDVPEFRGASRLNSPQWLLVAAHHSGLFERFRMPIATGVSWFGAATGGEFVFYPDGPYDAPVALPAAHNTAILLDTDSCFHGVDRVSEHRTALPDLAPGMQLVFDRERGEQQRWRAMRGDECVAEYGWSDLRFSISWKAYCYADAAEQRSVAEHSDDVAAQQIFDTLVEQLRDRGRVAADERDRPTLGRAIMKEFIRFPPPSPAASPPGASASEPATPAAQAGGSAS